MELLDDKYQIERIFAITSLLVMTLILAGSILFIIPGLLAAVVYALYAPVVIMEQHGVRGTLRRSRTLSRRAFWTALVITLVQFALPVLVWRAAVTTDFTLQLNDDFSPKHVGFNFSMSGRSVPVIECFRHPADCNHGIVALSEDAESRRRIVARYERPI